MKIAILLQIKKIFIHMDLVNYFYHYDTNALIEHIVIKFMLQIVSTAN